MRAAILIGVCWALTSCGGDDGPLVFGEPDDPLFDWGLAGQPAAQVRPLEYLVGDWVLCRNEACSRVDRFGLRLLDGGHARLLQVSLSSGRLRRCFAESRSFARWRLETGILTVEVDPTIPDLRYRDRIKGNVRFQVEQRGEAAYWTLLPPDHDRDSIADIDLPRFGALSESVEALPLRAVRLRPATDTETCVSF